MGKGSEQFFQRRHSKDGQQVHNKMLNMTNHQRNANQNRSKYHRIPVEWLLQKKQEITSPGEDVEKCEPSFPVCGKVNWCSHNGKQQGGFPKKRVTI